MERNAHPERDNNGVPSTTSSDLCQSKKKKRHRVQLPQKVCRIRQCICVCCCCPLPDLDCAASQFFLAFFIHFVRLMLLLYSECVFQSLYIFFIYGCCSVVSFHVAFRLMIHHNQLCVFFFHSIRLCISLSLLHFCLFLLFQPLFHGLFLFCTLCVYSTVCSNHYCVHLMVFVDSFLWCCCCCATKS